MSPKTYLVLPKPWSGLLATVSKVNRILHYAGVRVCKKY